MKEDLNGRSSGGGKKIRKNRNKLKESSVQMLNIDQALETILRHVNVLDVEEKLLFQCVGQVAAEDVCSKFSLPLTAGAAPDGYALRSDDITAASRNNPVTLRVIGTVRAGSLPKRLVKPGTAMRIMTGSVLPEGADCVVRFEDTDEPGDKNGPNPNNPSEVKVFLAEKPGANIRPAGSTVKKGALVLPGGKAIGPAQISALVAIGKARIKVIRRPRIAVIATGDELISMGRSLSAGKSYNCNGAAIAALITHYGGVPRVLGIARDNESSVLEKIQKSISADAIITTGGVSMGDYDLVRLVISKIGQVIFSGIKMGPGRSFVFGTVNRGTFDGCSVPVFALSGPPVGCLNNFETLVRPALLKMLGFTVLDHPVVKAITGDSVSGKKPVSFVKWTSLDKVDGEYRVVMNTPDGTGMLAEMATANSLTIIPEGTEIRKGDSIKVLPLDWCRD
jgi:molybdopterin molybdotransferase